MPLERGPSYVLVTREEMGEILHETVKAFARDVRARFQDIANRLPASPTENGPHETILKLASLVEGMAEACDAFGVALRADQALDTEAPTHPARDRGQPS